MTAMPSGKGASQAHACSQDAVWMMQGKAIDTNFDDAARQAALGEQLPSLWSFSWDT